MTTIGDRERQTFLDSMPDSFISNPIKLLSFKAMLGYLAGTPIASSVALAFYSYRSDIPFFQALNEPGSSLIVLNLFVLLFILFYTALTIFPSLVRHFDRDGNIDFFIFEQNSVSDDNTVKERLLHFVCLFSFVLPGFSIISIAHFIIICSVRTDQNYGTIMYVGFIFFTIVGLTYLLSALYYLIQMQRRFRYFKSSEDFDQKKLVSSLNIISIIMIWSIPLFYHVFNSFSSHFKY